MLLLLYSSILLPHSILLLYSTLYTAVKYTTAAVRYTTALRYTTAVQYSTAVQQTTTVHYTTVVHYATAAVHYTTAAPIYCCCTCTAVPGTRLHAHIRPKHHGTRSSVDRYELQGSRLLRPPLPLRLWHQRHPDGRRRLHLLIVYRCELQATQSIHLILASLRGIGLKLQQSRFGYK